MALPFLLKNIDNRVKLWYTENSSRLNYFVKKEVVLMRLKKETLRFMNNLILNAFMQDSEVNPLAFYFGIAGAALFIAMKCLDLGSLIGMKMPKFA